MKAVALTQESLGITDVLTLSDTVQKGRETKRSNECYGWHTYWGPGHNDSTILNRSFDFLECLQIVL